MRLFSINAQEKSNGYLKAANIVVATLPVEQLPTVRRFIPVPEPGGVVSALFLDNLVFGGNLRPFAYIDEPRARVRVRCTPRQYVTHPSGTPDKPGATGA